MPAGRPTLYRPEYCEQVIDHMAQGLSFEAFAGRVGVTKRTLYDWVEAHPEFLEAKQLAYERCRIFWEQKGIDGLAQKGFQERLWALNMKNRFGWTDARDIKHSGSIGTHQTPAEEVYRAKRGKAASPQAQTARRMDAIKAKLKEGEGSEVGDQSDV